MGHGRYYPLPVRYADVLHRLNDLPRHLCLEQMEGATAQVGSCRHLLAHCRFLLAYHPDCDARTGILGMEPFYLYLGMRHCRHRDELCQSSRTTVIWRRICFVGMGLSVLVAFKPLIDSVSPATVIWIIAEGVCYITGAVFYSINKKRYMHSVFHFFVLAGSVCHIIAVWDILMKYI